MTECVPLDVKIQAAPTTLRLLHVVQAHCNVVKHQKQTKKKIHSCSNQTKRCQSCTGGSIHCQLYYFTSFLPEGEDHEAGDDENGCKHGEDEVARFSPTCVVEHFG